MPSQSSPPVAPPGFPKKSMHYLPAADLPRALERCRRLLDKLLQHEDGWVFAKPVDTHSLELRDYLSVIAEPMDLGTVSRRLELRRYQNLLSFAKDVRRTFSNAMTYNNKGDDVYESAAKLSRIFESGWASILAALPSPPPVAERRARLKDELPRLPVDLQGKAVVIMKDIGGWIQEVDGRVEVDFDKADEATLDKLEWLLALVAMRQALYSPTAAVEVYTTEILSTVNGTYGVPPCFFWSKLWRQERWINKLDVALHDFTTINCFSVPERC